MLAKRGGFELDDFNPDEGDFLDDSWGGGNYNESSETSDEASWTKLERAGYKILDSIGKGYVRQAPVCGGYRVDALYPELDLAIEFDGDYVHGNPEHYPEPDQRQRGTRNNDWERGYFLARAGLRVLRFWEN
jgi:very-short-patch-repair endonuclease